VADLSVDVVRPGDEVEGAIDQTSHSFAWGPGGWPTSRRSPLGRLRRTTAVRFGKSARGVAAPVLPDDQRGTMIPGLPQAHSFNMVGNRLGMLQDQ